MTLASLIPILTGLVALLIGIWNVIRSEQIKRQGRDSGMHAQVETLERKLEMLELRLGPLFKVMDQRLAAMFHQPHPDAARLDRLLERYQTDPTELRSCLSDRDLQELIQGIYHWAQQTARGAPTANPEEYFRATFFLAQLDGLRDVRAFVRAKENGTPAKAQPEESSVPWWISIFQKLVALYRSSCK